MLELVQAAFKRFAKDVVLEDEGGQGKLLWLLGEFEPRDDIPDLPEYMNLVAGNLGCESGLTAMRRLLRRARGAFALWILRPHAVRTQWHLRGADKSRSFVRCYGIELYRCAPVMQMLQICQSFGSAQQGENA